MAYQDSSKDRSASDTGSISQFIAQQREPLLVPCDVEANAAEPEKKISYRNLPNKGQLALLCIARMADPLAATSIQVWPNSFYQNLNLF